MIAQQVECNIFGCPPSTEIETFERKARSKYFHTTGIWLLASKINHSCCNNCDRSFVGNLQIVRAAQDLPAGSELGFRYLDTDGVIGQKKLTSTWGFTCDYAICEDETV